jgi:hypothetical protein
MLVGGSLVATSAIADVVTWSSYDTCTYIDEDVQQCCTTNIRTNWTMGVTRYFDGGCYNVSDLMAG